MLCPLDDRLKLHLEVSKVQYKIDYCTYIVSLLTEVCPDELCHHPSQTCTKDSGQWKCICAHGFELLEKSCESTQNNIKFSHYNVL